MSVLQTGGAGRSRRRDSEMLAVLQGLVHTGISAHVRVNVNQGEKRMWEHQLPCPSWTCPLLGQPSCSPPQPGVRAQPFQLPPLCTQREAGQVCPIRSKARTARGSRCCQPGLDAATCPAPSSRRNHRACPPCQSHPRVLALHPHPPPPTPHAPRT